MSALACAICGLMKAPASVGEVYCCGGEDLPGICGGVSRSGLLVSGGGSEPIKEGSLDF